MVTQAIVQQFSTPSVAALQCGTIEKLMIDASQQQQSSDTPVVAYQVPLLIDRKDIHSLVKRNILGPKTPKDALLCLEQAPLLEDLASWSHWDLVFAPYLGDIAVFLNTHCKGSVYALELSPGRLVRIESSSSVADFVEAVKDADAVRTAGHLVTMVVRSGNVHDIPKQLLANHIQAKLEKDLLTSSTNSDQEMAASFIFSCLIRMPLHICQFLASEVNKSFARGTCCLEVVYRLSVGVMRCVKSRKQSTCKVLTSYLEGYSANMITICADLLDLRFLIC